MGFESNMFFGVAIVYGNPKMIKQSKFVEQKQNSKGVTYPMDYNYCTETGEKLKIKKVSKDVVVESKNINDIFDPYVEALNEPHKIEYWGVEGLGSNYGIILPDGFTSNNVICTTYKDELFNFGFLDQSLDPQEVIYGFIEEHGTLIYEIEKHFDYVQVRVLLTDYVS